MRKVDGQDINRKRRKFLRLEDFCNSEINCFCLSFFKQPRFFLFFSFPRFLPTPTLALAKTKKKSKILQNMKKY
jgi:hypothetical protein